MKSLALIVIVALMYAIIYNFSGSKTFSAHPSFEGWVDRKDIYPAPWVYKKGDY